MPLTSTPELLPSSKARNEWAGGGLVDSAAAAASAVSVGGGGGRGVESSVVAVAAAALERAALLRSVAIKPAAAAADNSAVCCGKEKGMVATLEGRCCCGSPSRPAPAPAALLDRLEEREDTRELRGDRPSTLATDEVRGDRPPGGVPGGVGSLLKNSTNIQKMIE